LGRITQINCKFHVTSDSESVFKIGQRTLVEDSKFLRMWRGVLNISSKRRL